MKMRLLVTRLLLLFAIFSLPHVLLAQQKTVTGKVTVESTGIPIPNVTVTARGTRTGTQTASDGTFRLSVPTSATTLSFSSVGYTAKDVPIGTSESLNVTMVEATAQNLNEVVVIGYGTATRKTVTGAVASVKAKDFNQGVIAAPDQLLQNKVAGLEVTNTSGQPGAATTIQIRGNSSIRSSNNPLYVVDGVPLDGGSARPNIGAAFGTTPNSNPLLFIDPYSIAQIDVLKDAASAAIYGSRGANGVIVITTKKATTGPMKLDANVSVGFNAGYMKRFGVLDHTEYRAGLAKYRLNQVVTNGISTFDGGQNTDALKDITRSGLTQNYSLGMGGGNELGRFRASFLLSHTDGLLKKSALDKYLATLGGSYRFLDNRLTVDFSLIAGNYGEQLTSVSNTAGSEGNIISSALVWNPTFPFKNSSGLYNYPTNGSGNPLAFSDAYNDRSSVNSYLGNISASYKLLNNLEYKFLYGINHSVGSRETNVDGWLRGVAAISGLGLGAIANAELTSQIFTHTLNYKTAFTKTLNFDVVAGYEYYKSDFSGGSIIGRGFNTNLSETNRVPILYTKILQNAQVQTAYSPYQNPTTEIQSVFARANFNFNDNVVVTGSIRADGSSKFGINQRYGYFPAVGARWILSNASFMKSQKLFSNFALRGAYGITGNQEFPAGSSQEQFSLTSYNTFPQVVNGNPDLKWETTNSFNIGADFSFMRGKLFSSLDYYYKNTTDILFQTNAIQPAPSSVSFINLPADLINYGFEFALGYTFADSRKFGLEASMNVAYNKNNVKNFRDPNTGRDLFIQTGQINGQGVSGTLGQAITNNQPVNVYYLKDFEGFDANGNQLIGVKNPTPHYAGNPNPSWIGGFSTTARYDKLTLNLNFGGAFGYLIYNNTATSVTNISGIASGKNIDKDAYNSAERPSSGVGASTRFLEKGDYVKLRNVTLRYNLGNKGKYLKSVNAFVSGTNLLVITKFSGFDPEVNIDKSNNNYPSRSIEYVPYPTPRVITFGVGFSL